MQVQVHTEYWDEADRRKICSAFYSLTSTAQDAYLFGCITSLPPRLTLNTASKPRELSVRYVVNTGTGKFRICKLAFQNLHGITSSKVRHIVKQTKNGQPTVNQSLRGKHTHRPNRLPAEKREEVQNHIRSFPSESSHYSRAKKNANRRYLAPTLTINSMYRLYAKQCIKQPLSSTMYWQIFTTDFNLGFGSPRSSVISVMVFQFQFQLQL